MVYGQTESQCGSIFRMDESQIVHKIGFASFVLFNTVIRFAMFANETIEFMVNVTVVMRMHVLFHGIECCVVSISWSETPYTKMSC